MRRLPSSAWVWILLAVPASARAAVRGVPILPACVVCAPASAGAAVAAPALAGGALLGERLDGLTILLKSLEARGDAYLGMLAKEQVLRLRREAVERGLVPAGRARLMGTLRVISEPLALSGGTADVKGALDRAFERLESRKRRTQSARLTAPH